MRRRPEGQTSNSLTGQKNNFARASHSLFGPGPNRVMETASFDANVQKASNVNKQVNKRSEANVCHANIIQHHIFSFIVFSK